MPPLFGCRLAGGSILLVLLALGFRQRAPAPLLDLQAYVHTPLTSHITTTTCSDPIMQLVWSVETVIQTGAFIPVDCHVVRESHATRAVQHMTVCFADSQYSVALALKCPALCGHCENSAYCRMLRVMAAVQQVCLPKCCAGTYKSLLTALLWYGSIDSNSNGRLVTPCSSSVGSPPSAPFLFLPLLGC